MTKRLYVRMGGAAAPRVDYASLNPSLRKGAPFFDHNSPLLQMGQKIEDGQAAVGTFVVSDPFAEIESATFRLRPHATVELTEDASGSEYHLAYMRIAPHEVTRPRLYTPGDEVLHTVTVHDCNRDVYGIPFKAAWDRPEETAFERLQALQAAKLNGSSSTSTLIWRDTTTIIVDSFGAGHLVDDAGSVTMDAKTYPKGTEVVDIITDCAEQDGKMWGVTLHHSGGSTHRCLLFIDREDHTSFTSAVKISGDVTEWDPDDLTAPVFEPNFSRGQSGVYTDNDFVISGLVSVWGGTNDHPRTVAVETGDDPAQWETWWGVYHDGDSTTEAQATRRANRILAENDRQHATYRCSILMKAEQTHLITAGQSIDIKHPVFHGGGALGEYRTRRIAELMWEPNPDGRWWAHLFLDRPVRTRTPHRGKAQPKATSPKPAQPPGSSTSTGAYDSAGPGGQTTGSPLTLIAPATVNAGDLLVAHMNIENSTGGFVPPSGWTFHAQATSGGMRSRMYYREADGTEGGDPFEFGASNLGVAKYGNIYRFTGGVTGASLGAVTATFAANASSADAPAVSGQSGMLGCLFIALDASQVVANMTGESGVDWTVAAQAAGGIGEWAIQTGTLTAAGTSGGSMSLLANTDYIIMGLTIGEAVAVGGDAPGDLVGDDDTYARSDHIHIQLSHRDPTTTDDADDLYKPGDWWVRVDDVDNPTTLEGLWLLLDATAGAAVWDQIPAAAIGVADEGGYFDGTNIEDVLQEIGAGVAGGVTDHGDLTGLADDDHPQYLRASDGEKHVINVVAASGTTETLDLADGNVHDVTLTANCAVTLAGATAGVACRMAILWRQGSGAPYTVDWSAQTIEWVGDAAPTLETAENAWNWVTLVTMDGGTTWFGDGGAASSVTSADDIRDAGRWEVVVSGTGPPVATTNEAEDDWVYGWISG